VRQAVAVGPVSHRARVGRRDTYAYSIPPISAGRSSMRLHVEFLAAPSRLFSQHPSWLQASYVVSGRSHSDDRHGPARSRDLRHHRGQSARTVDVWDRIRGLSRTRTHCVLEILERPKPIEETHFDS
jgi:hypothetical protein